MGNAEFSRDEASVRQRRSSSTANVAARHVAFFFDLEPLLPSELPRQAYDELKQRIMEHLKLIARRQDRAIWAATGFFLLVDASERLDASATAERVRQALISSFADGSTAAANITHAVVFG